MSSRGSRKARTHRMDGAIAALNPLGFSKNLIRDTIRELLKVYGDNDAGWYFVEENYYKLVIDKIIEDQDREKEEHDAKMDEDKAISCVEAITIERSEQPLPLLEAGSSSRGEPSIRPESPHERSLINMEEFLPEGSPINLVESSPEGSPINLEESTPEGSPIEFEDYTPEGSPIIFEDYSPEKSPTKMDARRDGSSSSRGAPIRLDSSPESPFKTPTAPKRQPCYGWISEEED